MDLDYENPSRSGSEPSPSARTFAFVWTIIGFVISAAGSLFFLALTGDSYAPLMGLFFGVPATLGSAVLFTLPTLILTKCWNGTTVSGPNRWTVPLSILSPCLLGGSVAVAFFAPHTRGSTC